MLFLRDYALPVTLTFDVRMNNALRAAMITWFQQLPAIVVTLFPRDPLYPGLYISVSQNNNHRFPHLAEQNETDVLRTTRKTVVCTFAAHVGEVNPFSKLQ